MKKYTFPSDFLWGTATSAHQIEGNNKNSDWWRWEQTTPKEEGGPNEPSGIACDSYNRYEEDFELCSQMNNNAVRFSIEWARIEPERGNFDQKEIEHYRKMIQAAKGRGLKTYVTLHHFTNPQWLADMGGWNCLRVGKLFRRYARKCAEEFSDVVDAFITINEPQVLVSQGYLLKEWYPVKRNVIRAGIAHINLVNAHRKAYRAIKKVTDTPVGIVKNMMWFETVDESMFLDKIIAKIGMFATSDLIILLTWFHLDFIGLNYYFTNRIIKCKRKNPNDYLSDMGWWINPPGLERVLLHLKKYRLPVYITENGLADANDKYRVRFLRDHLISCSKAIEQGVRLKGYFHWSLIDNFEWHRGYWPKFGLVEIDRENNLRRIPRKSFYYYSEVCKNNYVTDEKLN